MARLIDEIARKHRFIGIQGKMWDSIREPRTRPPEWVQQGPVYAVFVRNFSDAGTLEEVRAKIPELKTLGVNTLWLLPVYPIGREDRKGTCGSPYAIADHKRIAADLGDEQALRELVETVHRHGMYVMLDFVGNHAARDHLHPDLLQPENTRSPSDWTDIKDFDFNNPAVYSYLREVMRYWVTEFDIDGYRCDVAGLVPDAFWQEVTGELCRIKPQFFMLAEWQRPLLQQDLFHAGYDWVLYLILKEIRNKQRVPGDIIRWERERGQIYPPETLLLRFTENHDLPRTSDTFGSEAAMLFGGLPFCLNGLPLIYAGQEWGIGHLPQLFEKDPVPWEKGDAQIYDYYRRLIRLRRDHPVLSSGSIGQISADSDDLLIFRKFSGPESLIVAANFGGRREATLPDNYEGTYRDLLSGESFSSTRIRLDRYRLYILIAD
jgi:glycosidase